MARPVSGASVATPLDSASGFEMANIASQEKRIHRAERERLENRRRTSQVKTWFRRLETAVGGGRRRDAPTRSYRSSSRGSTGP